MNYQQKKALFLEHSDRQVANILRNQVLDESRREYGGIWDPYAGWASQKSGMNALEPLILAYCMKESAYYHNEDVRKAIDAAFVFCENYRRPDGTFDLSDCNFFSAPDTSFGIQTLWRAYQIMDRAGEAPDIKAKLGALIEVCAEGVYKGGFHTPNHRWVNTSALLIAWKLTGKEHFFKRAQDYLAEGVDCSEDGEFTERSAGVYNTVNDYAMILIAELLGDDSYLSYARRNLDMMMTFYEPDGSVFTMNSTRQDNGQRMLPNRYYFLYYYLAAKCNIPEYFGFAAMILDSLIRYHEDLSDLWGFMLLYPEWEALPEYAPKVPEKYSILYPHSGIARIRQGKFTASFIRDNPTPFAVQLGEMCVYLRIGISYFNLRNLLTQTLEKTEEGYRMTMDADGTYRLPFGEFPGSSLWNEMDHSKRGTLVVAHLKVTMDLIEQENGVDLRVRAEGCDLIPFKFEFGIPANVEVTNSHFACAAQPGMQLIVKEGNVELDDGKEHLTFGPGFADNTYIRSRSGIVEPSRQNMNLYFTGMTNFDRTISFRYE
ncbi:MAG: hypothetical protein ACOX6P_07190 [Candidatus Merdivicinus sp.]|jgi:hypothetical protein